MIDIFNIQEVQTFTTFYINDDNREMKYQFNVVEDNHILSDMYTNLLYIREKLKNINNKEVQYILTNFLVNAFTNMYEFKTYYTNLKNPLSKWVYSPMYKNIIRSIYYTNNCLMKIYRKPDYKEEKFMIYDTECAKIVFNS